MPAVNAVPVFSETNSAEIVARRFLRSGEGQLPKVLASLVGHLHQIVREARPTHADWRRAIAFLTEVGHASDERRQEWVLLSDLLGVTALVEEVNSQRPKGATPNTGRGPFYRGDAPKMALGANISLDGIGTTLKVTGHVRDLDGGSVAGAVIETWQANAEGFYENQQPDLQPEFNLRGVFAADVHGDFHYASIRPAGYGVPDDGPVGRLLGGIGCPLHRPAHIHFIIRAEGFETVTTQVFDADDPRLGEDALFGVRRDLIADFTKGLDFTFVLGRARKARQAA